MVGDGIPDMDEFLDDEEEWHYFAGGLSLGTIAGVVIGMIVVLVLLWIIKGKDSKSD